MPDVCSECGARLRQGARFCQVCGAPISAQPKPDREYTKQDPNKCTRCGNTLLDGTRFCGKCGQSVVHSPVKDELDVKPVNNVEHTKKPQLDTAKVQPRVDSGIHEIPILSKTDIPSVLDSSTEDPSTPIEIPEEMILILYGRKRAPEIKKELVEHKEELDALSEKMEVGLLTKKEAMEQLDIQKKKISGLQTEQAQLEDVASVPIEIERLDEELEKIKQWEEKLENLKQVGEVSDAVYKKVQREYNEKRSIVEQNLNTQVLSLTQWADLLKKRSIRLAQELETQKVKLNVEDKSSDDGLKQMKETEKELTKMKIAEEQARIILQKFI